jgi:diguanylate cyclase (GGDEF)-like protein
MRLQSAMREFEAAGVALAAIMVDIDHFKRINDDHGHECGDRALQQVAELLAARMRRTDIVARYGGEEFVVLMPATTLAMALARIEQLRQEVAMTPINVGRNEMLRVSFSAGVAGTPDDDLDADDRSLMSIADQRLLTAKRNGRGRSVGSETALRPERAAG